MLDERLLLGGHAGLEAPSACATGRRFQCRTRDDAFLLSPCTAIARPTQEWSLSPRGLRSHVTELRPIQPIRMTSASSDPAARGFRPKRWDPLPWIAARPHLRVDELRHRHLMAEPLAVRPRKPLPRAAIRSGPFSRAQSIVRFSAPNRPGQMPRAAWTGKKRGR